MVLYFVSTNLLKHQGTQIIRGVLKLLVQDAVNCLISMALSILGILALVISGLGILGLWVFFVWVFWDWVFWVRVFFVWVFRDWVFWFRVFCPATIHHNYKRDTFSQAQVFSKLFTRFYMMHVNFHMRDNLDAAESFYRYFAKCKSTDNFQIL